MQQPITVTPNGAPTFPLTVPAGSTPEIVQSLAQELARAGAHVAPGELAIVSAEVSGPPLNRNLLLVRELADFYANSRSHGFMLLHYLFLSEKDPSLPGCQAPGKVRTSELYAQFGWAPYIADAEQELLRTSFVRTGRGRNHDLLRLAPNVSEAMETLLQLLAETRKEAR